PRPLPTGTRAALGAAAALGLACLLLAAPACQPAPDSPPGPGAESQTGPPLFEDVTARSGLDFTHRHGEQADLYTILESLGGGVVLLDYDGDGLLDIFLPGGGHFDVSEKDYKERLAKDPTFRPKILPYPCKLYRNLGGFRFQDVTAEVLPSRPGFYTHGGAVA